MTKEKLLQSALAAFGLIFCLVYVLAMLWPEGWLWHEGPPASSPYFMMIVAVYATLGVFLMRAAVDPPAHRSLIQFTIWSSLAHGAIMAAQAVVLPHMREHLYGDVPALLLVALVLGWLTLEEKVATAEA